jgi:hypothetical protein
MKGGNCMKKLTYDEVKKEFELRGYQLVSTEYINSNQKLEYICLKHPDEGVQQIDYNHFRRGQGCRFCGKENKKNGKQKNLEDYQAKELTESKGMEFVKITRENSKLYVYYICPQHRQYGVQKTTLMSMRRMRVGCTYCIGRHKTTESFKKELFQINPNIVVLGEYIDATTAILCKCLIDGHEWYSTPNNLLSGCGCPVCGKIAGAAKRTKTNEQFLYELSLVNSAITPLDPYVNAKEKIRVKCNVCGHVWYVEPDGLLQGRGCPECAKIESHNRQVKSNEQFLKELAEVNPTLIPLEPYYNDHTKILILCTVHNYVWLAAPNKILHRRCGCPKCNLYSGEEKIINILEDLMYTVEPQKRFDDCRDKHTLPFDVYVKELNLLIEYDGEGHYRPIPRGDMSWEEAEEALVITQKHDVIKTKYCQDHNIPLIRIPYWEQKNLYNFLIEELKQYKIN